VCVRACFVVTFSCSSLCVLCTMYVAVTLSDNHFVLLSVCHAVIIASESNSLWTYVDLCSELTPTTIVEIFSV